MSKKINWKYNTSADDQLVAVENAMCEISNAMDELEGIGELMDYHSTLQDAMRELEAKKDELESYLSGEHEQMIAELTREYYRSVM